MQEIRSSNPPVVTGICDPSKSRAQHHGSLKLGSKLNYLKNYNPLKDSVSVTDNIEIGIVKKFWCQWTVYWKIASNNYAKTSSNLYQCARDGPKKDITNGKYKVISVQSSCNWMTPG